MQLGLHHIFGGRVSFLPRILINREALIWIAALIWLAITAHSSSFSLCPIHALGLDFCPGCGIGHGIGLALRGEFSASLSAHPLGIPALFILLHRIFWLSFKSTKNPISPPLPQTHSL